MYFCTIVFRYLTNVEDAIKLSMGIYIITGGAIKLTRTMQEREHTLQELEKMEKVRNFLIREHVFDEDSFTDYQQEVEL